MAAAAVEEMPTSLEVMEEPPNAAPVDVLGEAAKHVAALEVAARVHVATSSRSSSWSSGQHKGFTQGVCCRACC